jgi:adenylate cyclase
MAQLHIMSVKSITGQLGNITQWQSADKVALACLIILPFHIGYAAVAYYLVSDPEIAPYMDHAFTERVPLWIETRIMIPAWLVMLVLARVLRHRARESRWLVYAGTQLYFVWVALCSYFFGSHTALYTSLTLIAGAAYDSVLFGTRVTMVGVASFFAIVSATTILEQLGLIPYGPMWVGSPVVDGHLATSWLLGFGSADILAVVAVLAVVFFLVEQWRARQLQLSETTDQLARANELVSRYVAQQVAEQIRLGNYDAIDRQYRRRLTIFFSDVKGFTEVADHIEPEELSDIINEYFAEMTAIAQDFGGTIDKFMGDAIMIFFGAPVATHDQDHALRAVRMAMAMQARMTKLCRRWEGRGLLEPFEIRIGINTGMASVGNFGTAGRMDYTAIGRQVNLAARLQVNSDPGRILLSHATWVLVCDEIHCEPKGEIQVKGIRDAVTAYEVTEPYPVDEPAADAVTAGGAA